MPPGQSSPTRSARCNYTNANNLVQAWTSSRDVAERPQRMPRYLAMSFNPIIPARIKPRQASCRNSLQAANSSASAPLPGKKKTTRLLDVTPHATAARCKLPPPSMRSFLSPAAYAGSSDGVFGIEVSSSITASAFEARSAASTALLSSASAIATSAPNARSLFAPRSECVIPVTVCPLRISSAING